MPLLDRRSWFRRPTPIEGQARGMELELEQQKKRINHLERELHIRESGYRESGYSQPYPWFNQLISPIAAYYDGIIPIAAPAPTIWDPTLNLGVFITEAYLDIVRAYTRLWVSTTPQANGVIESLTDYTIGTGFDYEVQEARGQRVGKEAMKAAQRIVDEFMTGNQMFETEVDWFKRLRVDGELFYRLYPGEEGVTQLRTLEPWQVRGASSSPEEIFGVVTAAGDREQILGFNVTYSGVLGDAEVIGTEEMGMLKRNTAKQVKRGISDFFCTQSSFQQTVALLSNSLQGEAARQAIIWIQETTGAANQVTQLNSQGSQINGPGCTLGNPGQINGPMVATVDKNLQFKPGPVGASTNSTALLAEGYRAVSVYFRVPVWMISGSSDSSFASSLVENDPLAVMVKREQKALKESLRRLLLQVLTIAEDQGELAAGTAAKLNIVASCPPVVTRDKGAETLRNQTLAEAGIMSRRTWAEVEELDYDEEQASILEDGPVVAGDDVNQRTAAPSTEPAATQARQAPHPLSKE